MKLLLLQLSDIHIRTPGDGILTRSDRIVEPLKALEPAPDLCLIALTGDISFAGTAEQFALARKWVSQVRSALERSYPQCSMIRLVAIPGNHDCDLRNPLPARNALIAAMRRDAHVADDSSTIPVCVQPQDEFFQFRMELASEGLVQDGRRYYEYRFELNDETVLIRCCNTAWVSENPEAPGQLIYPESAIPVEATSDRIVITMLHHPYNWLAPMNARALRARVQGVSDVILTGHEHSFGVRQQVDETGGTALYVEGLALQGHGHGEESGYNVILIDTEAAQHKVIQLEWERGRFSDRRGPTTSWTPLRANPRRNGQRFLVSDGMRKRLLDAQMTLSHPVRGNLSLEDIFVYPDVIELRHEPSETQPRVVRGERLLEEARQEKRVLITGPRDSGKSALAKQLFIDALSEGLVPLLLDGKRLRLRGDERDRRELRNAFEDQFDERSEAYDDVSIDDRVIIVDDCTAFDGGAGTAAIFEYLTNLAGTVVMLAHDVAQQLRELVGLGALARGRAPFKHYRILGVSHVRREEMIARYVGLAGSATPEESESLRADMRTLLRAAIGRYAAPATPLAVISILQARAFNDQINLSQSSHGYYYELLIKRALLLRTTQAEVDVRLAYLTELAWRAFTDSREIWDEGWLMDFHREFTTERRLGMRFQDALETLLEVGILEEDAAEYRFKYKYIYYYFVARQLNALLTSDQGKATIVGLTRDLEKEDSANILLFLTHFSKDAAIIDPMLEQAASLFVDVDPADLAASSYGIPGLDQIARDAAKYVEKPIDEARREYAERLDALEGYATGEHEVPARAVKSNAERRREQDEQMVANLLSRVYVAFRTMHILGQLLKNFPGTLSGSQKVRITEAVFSLSRRTLGAIQDVFRTRPAELMAEVMAGLREEHPDFTIQRVTVAAMSTMYWQYYMTSLGLVQRTARDVESPLLDLIFDEVVREDEVPATKLIRVAIALGRAGRFPESQVLELAKEFEGNALALRILRSLVVTHFHLFEYDPAMKQRMCSQLEIQYMVEPPRSRRRLV